MDKLRIYINGTEVSVDARASFSYNVLQHCDRYGIQLPRFCYHDHLSIAGNCRMCLVESGSSVKPILACSTEVTHDLEIYTTSLLVKQAREQMLEFLLINHPLDCPICDQGGECDLQDLTYVYGSDRSRYSESKRVVSQFYFGPLIKVIMTRCIQCTRCVRFFDEFIGVPLLGSTGRGTSNTITPYLNVQTLFRTYSGTGRHVVNTSLEIVGNVADICPVGALTVRPGSYMLRAWEVVSTETIDVLDSVCSNIRIDTCGSSIVRILPRLNAALNDEWITDKIRFIATGLYNARLLVPTLRTTAMEQRTTLCNLSFVSVSWEYAFEYVAYCLTVTLLHSVDATMRSFVAYSGSLLDSFSVFMFKLVCAALGLSSVNKHVDNDSDLRSSYIFLDSLHNIFNYYSVLCLLGINMRTESPILNIRMHHSLTSKQLNSVFYVGTNVSAKLSIVHVGLGSSALQAVLNGSTVVSTIVLNNNYKVASITGRVVSNLNLPLSLLGNAHCLSSSVGEIHVRELCALQCYNARSMFAY